MNSIQMMPGADHLPKNVSENHEVIKHTGCSQIQFWFLGFWIEILFYFAA